MSDDVTHASLEALDESVKTLAHVMAELQRYRDLIANLVGERPLQGLPSKRDEALRDLLRSNMSVGVAALDILPQCPVCLDEDTLAKLAAQQDAQETQSIHDVDWGAVYELDIRAPRQVLGPVTEGWLYVNKSGATSTDEVQGVGMADVDTAAIYSWSDEEGWMLAWERRQAFTCWLNDRHHEQIKKISEERVHVAE